MGDCGSGGTRSRAVWCTHTEGWTSHHANCDQQEKPESQRRCFKVCDWHLELFEWDVSGWGSCEPGGEAGPCIMAQHGLQRRSARCLQKLDRSVVAAEICEHLAPQPPLEQACLVPCPRDCVVTDFSPWSQCSGGCTNSLRHRTRAVIAPPLYGGAPCPNLTESQTCAAAACPLGEEEHTYSLKVGPWGECRLPHHEDASLDLGEDSGELNVSWLEGHKAQHRPHTGQVGYQTRAVSCVRSDGRHTVLSLCVQDAVPLTSKTCVIAKDCETSEWSAWSSCSQTCSWGDLAPGFRSRHRSVWSMAMGNGKLCPELEEKEACSTGGRELLKPCPRFSWRTSEWKACQVSLFDQQSPQHHKHAVLCGGGIQTREVYCVQITVEGEMHRLKEVSRPVDGKFCLGPAPSASQLCDLPCPSECAVSSWLAWGPCLPEDCRDRQGRRGFRMRQRHVIVDPVGTLAGCPHLVESIPCEDPTCYEWIVSAGICVADHGKCGPGKHILKTVCKSKKGSAQTEIHYSHSSIDRADTEILLEFKQRVKGSKVKKYHITFAQSFHVLMSWLVKSLVQQTACSVSGPSGPRAPIRAPVKVRRAAKAGVGPSWHFQQRSHTEDEKLGRLSKSGFNSAVAIVSKLRKACAKGECGGSQPQHGFEKLMNNRCPDSTRPETVRPCLLPCKKDCIVTPFSEWTRCPTACQPGNATAVKQSRYRIIIQDAANGGQTCPDTLYEERECEDIPVCPVYRWKTHRWSHCVLVPESVRQNVLGHNEACGHGLQSRAVTCLTENNESADVSECMKWAGPMPPLVQDCLIPCKDDCTFTPWSKFTACSFDCESTKTRRRSLTGRSRKRDKCQNTEVYPQVETELCPCEVFTSQPHGNWSDCIIGGGKLELQQGVQSHGDTKECGEGVRLRAIACYDKAGRLVEPSRCSSSGWATFSGFDSLIEALPWELRTLLVSK
ncbi:hypothetical protein CIB84_000018 [Bambusicola thoracicus]|uniref:Spondin-like TSP1 domain-containing protein n=1 Tax=Bambusicola thoracicus TaxID=9083 RepID=A0A2P4TIP2_BAMTH|nr:hypothetical protein CIB84_000018 [Bambusicola thoracicus]